MSATIRIVIKTNQNRNVAVLIFPVKATEGIDIKILDGPVVIGLFN